MEVMAEILEIAEKGAKKTKLVYGANLNFKILKDYLEDLEKAGLIKSHDGIMETTVKGKEYLTRFYGFEKFLTAKAVKGGWKYD